MLRKVETVKVSTYGTDVVFVVLHSIVRSCMLIRRDWRRFQPGAAPQSGEAPALYVQPRRY